jgi:hypothetical protein
MNIGTMVDSVLVDAILDLGGVTWGDGNLSSGWGYVFAAFFKDKLLLPIWPFFAVRKARRVQLFKKL